MHGGNDRRLRLAVGVRTGWRLGVTHDPLVRADPHENMVRDRDGATCEREGPPEPDLEGDGLDGCDLHHTIIRLRFCYVKYTVLPY